MKRVVLVFLICVCCFSCSKKRSGIFKYSGKIVDAFDGQGIDSIQVYIGNKKAGGLGQTYIYEMTDDVLTNTIGEFNVTTDFERDVKPYFVIDTRFKNSSKSISDKYTIRDQGFDYFASLDKVFAGREMTEDEYANQTIELMRNGMLELNFTKSPTIAQDEIQISYSRTITNLITADTTIYVITVPDELNKFFVKRNDLTLWSQDVTVGIKGDTVVANIQL